jgi:hypothetical protein
VNPACARDDFDLGASFMKQRSGFERTLPAPHD